MSRAFRPVPNEGSSYDFNLYYNPEKCGLELIDSIETGGSYEFCTTLAVKDTDTGEVFLAQDSGCSCPTPFENFHSTGDLIPFENDDQVRRLVDAFHYDKPPATEVHAFVQKIRAEVR